MLALNDRSAPYVWIFKVDGNIIRSSSYNHNNLEVDIKKLKDSGNDIDLIYEESKRYPNDKNVNIFRDDIEGPLSQLIYIIYNLSGSFENPNKYKVTNLFKSLGYDGIFDDIGLGVIHKAVPVQAVIFSAKNCKPIDLVKNEDVDRSLSEIEKRRYDSIKSKIYNLDNPKVLTEIVLKSTNADFRIAALYQIKDKDILNYIFNNSKDEKICKEAFWLIKDENDLINIVKSNKDPEMRIDALKRIKDQDIFIWVVNNDNDKEVRMEAIKKIDSHSGLDKIINRNDIRIRKCISERSGILNQVQNYGNEDY